MLNLFIKNEVDEKSELELIPFLILTMFFLILLIIGGIGVFNRTKNLSESSVDEIVVVENKPINKNGKNLILINNNINGMKNLNCIDNRYNCQEIP